MLRPLKHILNSDLARCLLSAALLIIAYPEQDWWLLAWVGLIPLMIALDGKKPWAAFKLAYACGLLFFSGTLFWFFHLTQWFSYIAAVGIILLFAYLALYFGIFGLFYSLFSRQKPLFKLILLPSVWVCLEFIRGYLFTGFDWVCLGHSQYKNFPMIQIADVTGVYGVSFLIIMVNFMFKEWITVPYAKKTSQERKSLFVLFGITFLTVALVAGYGEHHLSSSGKQYDKEEKFDIAIIQANTPQEQKWHKPAWPGILEQYISLTNRAMVNKPDLIIWPETSYPGYLWDDNSLFIELQEYVNGIQTPLLLGSVIKEEGNYYNSALLLSKTGEVAQVYRKIHLVPFGEFLPLRSVIPFLSKLVAIGDFTAGKQWTTFSLPPSGAQNDPPFKFSVLICFEDTVARLSRQFVRRGAQLLVNITNDAWFGISRAPFMHMQSAVFRAIENRRDLVRAANTGVSCFIDRWGKIVNYVRADSAPQTNITFISDYALSNVAINSAKTFYTKFGDVFTIICFGCILLGIVTRKRV